ncbi:MAG: DNA-protecting protein DprA [Hyphomicrobiales bacterium]|nr:MAG: DNA-protecting protein DprA [Hyphomicrobiales bacterium]
MTEDPGKATSTGVHLSDAQRLAWLRLIRSENVGPATFRTLLNHYGSAAEALRRIPDLSRRGGSKRTIRICSLQDAEAEMALAERIGARFVALGEPTYPALLRQIDGPPPLIAVRGSTDVLNRAAIAIVGSRNASLAGIKMTERLVHGLSREDLVIVSGLARGIDTAAHKASLATGTVAVLAGGLDHIYPPENEPLLRAIIDAGGAIIGEMPFGWSPRAHDFPRRNRLISGLSLGVVIVEATKRSGSLHTARFALEQNREVFAVPGSPLDPRSEGCNRLIRDGAVLIRDAADISAELSPSQGSLFDPHRGAEEPDRDAGDISPQEPDDSARTRIADALGPTPTGIDDLIRHTGLPAGMVHVILLELELAGRLERHGGQRVSLLL